MGNFKRTILFVVAALVVFGVVILVLNSTDGGGTTRSPIPTPFGPSAPSNTGFESSRSIVPLAMQAQERCGRRCQKRHNKVVKRHRHRKAIPLAKLEAGCRGYEDTWASDNPLGQVVYRTTFTVKWCWNGKRPGKFTAYVTNRDFYPGNQWWNQWKLVRWHDDNRYGHGCNDRYCYRFKRFTADVESCFAFGASGCWFHESPWIQETLRTDGTSDASMGV